MPEDYAGAISPLQQAVETVQPLAEELWASLAGVKGRTETTRILFTSAESGAGTSVITAACGMGLARNLRQEVTVVEAHLARPSLASYLGLPGVPGLSDMLMGRAKLAASRYQVPGCPSLFGLPAGSARAAVAGEFADERARELFEAIGSQGRYVLFDTPAVVDHPEVLSLLPLVDAVVLVLRARSTSKAQASKAVRLIEEAGGNLLGSVLNRFKPDGPF